MPPQFSSRLVLPAGFSQIRVLMSGPASLHPPQWGFAIGTIDPDEVGLVLADFLTDGTNAFKNRLYEGYTVDRAVMRTPDNTYEIPLSVPGEGENADLVTPAVSALIKVNTGTAGRRGSGRMYWPGCLAESDVDNAGVIDPAAVTSLQAVADRLLTAIGDNTATEMFLLHSYRWPYGEEDPGEPVGFPDPSEVTNLVAQSMVATQRRRQR